MKAISLWQPWASLIADRRKRIETRHWPIPESMLGQPIAIHAAKKIDRDACNEFGYSYFLIPRGCIVCVATVYRCTKFTEENVKELFARLPEHRQEERQYGDFAPGRYGWFIGDVRKCVLVNAVGRQRFFSVDVPIVFPQ